MLRHPFCVISIKGSTVAALISRGDKVAERRDALRAAAVDLEPLCGRPGPTGLCALRAHHARLIKTGDYQARSFTALEAAM